MNDTIPSGRGVQRVFLTHKQVDTERFFIAYESECFQFFVVFGVLSQSTDEKRVRSARCRRIW